MSCRFCATEQHTVRVVANNAVVKYACGTAFFQTDHELGEPFDACWAQSRECKAKAPVKEDGKRTGRLDTYPVAHVDALKARIATLERELEQAKEDRARAAMDARNPLLARITALRAAGDALARHVAQDQRGQTARQLVEAWEEAAK